MNSPLFVAAVFLFAIASITAVIAIAICLFVRILFLLTDAAINKPVGDEFYQQTKALMLDPKII